MKEGFDKIHGYLDRLENELEAVEGEIRRCYRVEGGLVPPSLENKRRSIEEKIRLAKDALPRRLSEMLPDDPKVKGRITRMVIAFHLAFDFASEMCFRLSDELDRYGLNDQTLFPRVKTIARDVDRLAGRACEVANVHLQEFMTENDEYLRGMQRLTEDYITSKLGDEDE